MTSHFSSVADLSVWLKLDRHTSYKTKFMQVYTLQGFDQKNTIFQHNSMIIEQIQKSRAGGLWHIYHMQRNWPCKWIFLA